MDFLHGLDVLWREEPESLSFEVVGGLKLGNVFAHGCWAVGGSKSIKQRHSRAKDMTQRPTRKFIEIVIEIKYINYLLVDLGIVQ